LVTQTPVMTFFEKSPSTKPLFDQLVVAVLSRFPHSSLKIQPSQIALVDEVPYAAVWLPLRAIKGRPLISLIVSFGLDHELKHDRIIETNQPYPHRWMHHTVISDPSDIDDILLDWLSLAHEFSLRSPSRSPQDH